MSKVTLKQKKYLGDGKIKMNIEASLKSWTEWMFVHQQSKTEFKASAMQLY